MTADRALPPEIQDLSGSTTDRVTDVLRGEILTGRFAPGARLKLAELAARYRVSPLPVREALRRLEGERLVDLAAHRGAAVRGLSAKYVRDVYDVREALESLLTGRAAERATAAEVQSLRRLQARWEDAAGRGDAASLLSANLDFHAAIVAIADNPEAAELLPRGWHMTTSLRLRLGFSPARLDAIGQEHRAMLAAIAAGEAEEARRLSRGHVRSACAELLARLAEARLLPEGQPA